MAKNDYRKTLDERGVTAFVAYGRSMWPTIKNGKHSVVIAKKAERLAPYDVALFLRGNGAPVLHRVVEVLPDGYLMQGDGLTYTEKIDEDSVIGVLQGFYKGKRFIDASDEKHLKKVRRWYKSKVIRPIRLYFYNLKNRVVARIKGVKKGEENVD